MGLKAKPTKPVTEVLRPVVAKYGLHLSELVARLVSAAACGEFPERAGEWLAGACPRGLCPRPQLSPWRHPQLRPRWPVGRVAPVPHCLILWRERWLL